MPEREHPRGRQSAEEISDLAVRLHERVRDGGPLAVPADVAASLHPEDAAELEAMADRWKVVPLLQQGVPYREIHERTGVSVTTIGRVARTLEHGAGGYAAAIAAQPPSH